MNLSVRQHRSLGDCPSQKSSYCSLRPPPRQDGLPQVFAVNSLAPYILTCLIKRPKRLVYTSSGLHRSGDASLNDLTWSSRPWDASSAYADSKLHNVLLAFAVARKWHGVLSNAVDPGWAATKMGGRGAPDSIEEGSRTQAWLAVSQEKEALVAGRYFSHQQLRSCHPAAADPAVQEKYLSECARLSGVAFPERNYCGVLRDDGMSYGDYVEQLTYLLFLKIANERTRSPYNQPNAVPTKYNWPTLVKMDGDDLFDHTATCSKAWGNNFHPHL